jgi:hypothetical protein
MEEARLGAAVRRLAAMTFDAIILLGEPSTSTLMLLGAVGLSLVVRKGLFQLSPSRA